MSNEPTTEIPAVHGIRISPDGTVTVVSTPVHDLAQTPREDSKGRAVNVLVGQIYEYPVTFFLDAFAGRRRTSKLNEIATTILVDALFGFEGSVAFDDVWVFGRDEVAETPVHLHADVIELARDRSWT